MTAAFASLSATPVKGYGQLIRLVLASAALFSSFLFFACGNSDDDSGGSGTGASAPSCDTVCAHVATLCGSPGDCSSACGSFTATERTCASSAASCNDLESCDLGAVASDGSDASAPGNQDANTSTGTGPEASTPDAAPTGTKCGNIGDACSQDSDCKTVTGYACNNDNSITPEHDPFCDDGKCHDFQADCDSQCAEMGSSCAGLLYNPCD